MAAQTSGATAVLEATAPGELEPIFADRPTIVGWRRTPKPTPKLATVDRDEPCRPLFPMLDGSVHDPLSFGVVPIGLPAVLIKDDVLCPPVFGWAGQMRGNTVVAMTRYHAGDVCSPPVDLSQHEFTALVRYFSDRGPDPLGSPPDADHRTRNTLRLLPEEIEVFVRKTRLPCNAASVKRLVAEELNQLVASGQAVPAPTATVRMLVFKESPIRGQSFGCLYGRLFEFEIGAALDLTKGRPTRRGGEYTVHFARNDPPAQFICEGAWDRPWEELPPLLAPKGTRTEPYAVERRPFAVERSNLREAVVARLKPGWERHGIAVGSRLLDTKSRIDSLGLRASAEYVQSVVS